MPSTTPCEAWTVYDNWLMCCNKNKNDMKAKKLGKEILLAFCTAKLEGKSERYLNKISEVLNLICFTELKDKLGSRKVSTDKGLANTIREQRNRWLAVVRQANSTGTIVVEDFLFDKVIKDKWPEFSEWYDELVVNT